MDKHIDTGNLYHIVIHDRVNLISIEAIELFVKDKLNSSYYCISLEKENVNKHFHIIVETDIGVTDTQNRKIRKLINEFGIKGKGNLSTSRVKNKKQLLKYVLKDDGQIRTMGIPESDLILFKKLSYKKGQFNEAKALLEEKFFTDEIPDIYSFTEAFVKLKISYNQNLNQHRIREYALLIHFRKQPESVRPWVRSILENERTMNVPIYREEGYGVSEAE